MIQFVPSYRPMTMSVDLMGALADNIARGVRKGWVGSYAWDYLINEEVVGSKREFTSIFKLYDTFEEAQDAINKVEFKFTHDTIVGKSTYKVGIEIVETRDVKKHKNGFAPWLIMHNTKKKMYWVCHEDYDWFVTKVLAERVERFDSLRDAKGKPTYGRPLYEYIKSSRFKSLEKYDLNKANKENLRRLRLIKDLPGITSVFKEENLQVPSIEQLSEPTMHLMSYIKPSDFNQLDWDNRQNHTGLAFNISTGEINDGKGLIPVNEDKPILVMACGWFRFTPWEADVLGMGEPGGLFHNKKRESPKVYPVNIDQFPEWTVEYEMGITSDMMYRFRHQKDRWFTYVDRTMDLQEWNNLLNKFDEETYNLVWGDREKWGTKVIS